MPHAACVTPRREPSAPTKHAAPYRLVARKESAEFAGNSRTRVVRVGNAAVGGPRPTIVAGPCAVESRAQTLEIARAVAAAGADMLRGGAYKPRTSPYDFQGTGRAGLEILLEAREETGLPIVTEVMDPRLVEEVCAFADCLQIGARNMQNFPLLVEVGRSRKPVLLKRHWAATLEEWLCAAEYVAAQGNLDVILCERGIRTFSRGEYDRSTLDVNVVPAAQRETFLPVIVDPSHATGASEFVPAASAAAMGAGAHGLLIEVIGETADQALALCDGRQSIRPSALADIVRRARLTAADRAGRRVVKAARAPALLLALAACGRAEIAAPSAPEPPPFPAGATPTIAAGPDDLFEDVTARAGIRFVHRVADGRMDDLVEAVGAGATWFDADGDGRLDLFVAQQARRGDVGDARETSRLYRNRGDGTFEDVTERAGLAVSDYVFAALAFDFDADGAEDLYLLIDGKNRLFRNRGDGTFADVTDAAGVGSPACSVAGAVLDADGDGRLDLYVGNYVTFDPSYRKYYAPDAFPGPLAFPAQSDVLYLNRGDGTFRDATAECGLAVTPPGRAMGVTAWDYDLDGRTDLFVANDASAAFLFHNEGGGKFKERGLAAGVAYAFNGDAAAAMAGAAGDFDGDGLPDLHLTDAAYGSLYRNLGEGRFQDRVIASGLGGPCGQYVSWGGGFADFDDDGVLDLFVADGDLHHPTGRPDLFLRGKGDGTFEDAGARGGAYFRAELLSRGAAIADFDDDGRMDVLVTTIGDRAVLLRNRGAARTHWITLDLRGPRGNPTALGAIVTLEAGGRKRVQVATGNTGYLTQGDPRPHFGLGDVASVDRVEVRWPDGTHLAVVAPPIDRIVRIAHPEARR